MRMFASRALTTLLLASPLACQTVWDVTQAPTPAVADDGQDDTAAFRHVATMVGAGDTIHVPAGVYHIDPTSPGGAITFAPSSPIGFAISGHGAVIVRTGFDRTVGADNALFRFEDCGPVDIRGLSVDTSVPLCIQGEPATELTRPGRSVGW